MLAAKWHVTIKCNSGWGEQDLARINNAATDHNTGWVE
jgi:hypothetical protein